jgi:enoyl-CoA hydratase/carnithine racemase
MARRLLALPRESLRQTRQLLKQTSMPELQATIRQENLLFIKRLKSPEAQAALNAILNRSTDKKSLTGQPS